MLCDPAEHSGAGPDRSALSALIHPSHERPQQLQHLSQAVVQALQRQLVEVCRLPGRQVQALHAEAALRPAQGWGLARAQVRGGSGGGSGSGWEPRLRAGGGRGVGLPRR